MKIVTAKTFIKALGLLSDSPKKAKAFLRDTRLGHTEKMILHGFLLLRENRYAEIEETLNATKGSDPIIESQRLFLLGISANDQGRCLDSLPYFKQSLELMAPYHLERQQLMVNHALFTAYRNLKNREGMRNALLTFEDHVPRDVNESILIKRSTFYYLCFVGDYTLAKSVLRQLIELKPAMNDVQGLLFQMDRFDYAIKMEDYELAQNALTDLKQFRTFGSTANYKFMKALLGLLRDSAPLYLYEKDFHEIPLLYHQVKVLLSLEAGAQADALVQWQELNQQVPNIYGDQWAYHGDVCLFSRALKKLSLPESALEKKPLSKFSNKEELLLSLLRNSTAPLPKEHLYETLWGKKAEDKKDFEKLSSMLLRLKKKHHIEVKFKKGCYFLLRAQASKVS